MAGAGEWQLQTTAEYAKVRQQFDRPIGFFQAVKHPIVDMMICVDEARSLVYNAAQPTILIETMHLGAPISQKVAPQTWARLAHRTRLSSMAALVSLGKLMFRFITSAKCTVSFSLEMALGIASNSQRYFNHNQ